MFFQDVFGITPLPICQEEGPTFCIEVKIFGADVPHPQVSKFDSAMYRIGTSHKFIEFILTMGPDEELKKKIKYLYILIQLSCK